MHLELLPKISEEKFRVGYDIVIWSRTHTPVLNRVYHFNWCCVCMMHLQTPKTCPTQETNETASFHQTKKSHRKTFLTPLAALGALM